MKGKGLLQALFDLGLALIAVLLGWCVLLLHPLEPGVEVSVRKTDWMPMTVWCEHGYLRQHKFVESDGRAKYLPVRIGRFKFAWHKEMPVILVCAA